MTLPLDGVRVLEVANWLAAPAAAAMMADLGADVIKVEPPGGDDYRAAVAPIGVRASLRTSFGFQLDNRGKRSVTVALDRPGGPELVRRLAGNADIFLTNLLPARCQRHGLDFDSVVAANGRIVYVALSGYGSRGPDANRPGFDHAAFWAASGAMGLFGEPHEPPTDCRSGQGDHTTALNIFGAALAALRLRDLTGEAQHVDVTLQATGMWTLAVDYAAALASGEDPVRVSRAEPRHPLANCYRCADGRWIQLIMPRPFPAYWPRFCQLVGREDWTAIPDLAELRVRTVEIFSELDGVFGASERTYWEQALEEAGLIWAPVAGLREVIESDQVSEMGWLADVEHPVHGRFRTLNAPFLIRGAQSNTLAPAPEAGVDTSEVLAEIGLGADEIAELAANRVFG
jgi:crotonobetainyl-CoA:carnitine CoA-transferase CaiB-like acyl-CoA transferase